MKRKRILVLSTFILFPIAGVRAGQMDNADKKAALGAATAWLAILDSPNLMAASKGMADEFFALMSWPTQDQKVAAGAVLLAQQRNQYSPTYAVTRKLQPDSIKSVDSCNCGIRGGPFVSLSYDVKYTWTLTMLRSKVSKQGTEVLYMMHEKDGTWKPAAITLQLTPNFTN